MVNIRYAITVRGILKIVTVILGILSVSIMGHAFEMSKYNNLSRMDETGRFETSIWGERFYLSVATMWCVLSLGFLIRYILTEEIEKTHGDKYLDVGFHLLGGVLLITGSCLTIVSACNIEKTHVVQFTGNALKMQYKSEKIVSGVFGLANGVVYFALSALLLLGKRTENYSTESR